MRLRLTVQRHGLPDTSILWPTQDNPSPTIAELLEAVNDSVPIEAEQWGFEDYAVELKANGGKGYECLHYQRVSDVFREDDEVVIRPLLTQDIKTRKRSGRHQISADGYKLYDGLAYGKTLTRALASRPEVKIPPRKRRRITVAGEDDDSEEEQVQAPKALEETAEDDLTPEPSNQLVLHADFNDEEDDDEEDDEDFAPSANEDDSDVESQEMTTETRHRENAPTIGRQNEHSNDSGASDDNVIEDKSQSGDDEALEDLPAGVSRAKVQHLRSTFPTASVDVCSYILVGTNDDLEQAYDALSRGFAAVKSKSTVLKSFETSRTSKPVTRRTVTKQSSRKAVATSPSNEVEAIDLNTRAEDSPEDESDGGSLEMLNIPKLRSKRRKTSHQGKIVDPESQVLNPEHELPKMSNHVDPLLSGEEEDEESADEIGSLTKHYDQNGFPPGSIQGGKLITFGTDSVMAPSSRIPSPETSGSGIHAPVNGGSGLLGGLTSTPHIDQVEQTLSMELTSNESSSDDSEDEDDDSGSDASSSRDEDSSDSESDSDSSSSGSSSLGVQSQSRITIASSDSDSSSDSSSSEDEGPEIVSSKHLPGHVHSSMSHGVTSKSLPQANARTTPEKGTKATKTRNDRRRNAQKVKRLKLKGILPESATVEEYHQLSIDINSSPDDVLAALNALRASQGSQEQSRSGKHGDLSIENKSEQKSNDLSKEFAARREELLASLAAGGVEVGTASQSNHGNMDDTDAFASTAQIDAQESQKISNASLPEPQDKNEAMDSLSTPAIESIAVERSGSSQATGSGRRSKWDAGAGGRLLFGHLGVKPPKTKADEENVRQKLTKDIRPVPPPKAVEAVGVETISTPEPVADADDWMQRINYRAVECVQEGIVLSTPPFPFVQRWDPQQRRGGKRKHGDQSFASEQSNEPKKRKHRKVKQSYAEEQEYLDQSYQPSFPDTLNYDDDDSQLNTQDADLDIRHLNSVGDSQNPNLEEVPEDLAPLPENMSTLPDLRKGQARKGMTIAYKILEMNARWEPVQSEYRTAIVIETYANDDISVALAKRDRKQKNYDEETGERIYDKFEMPSDDEEEEEDDGMLRLSYDELSGPKILRDAPADLADNVDVEDSPMDNDDSQDPSGRENGEGTEVQESQESQPTGENKTPSSDNARSEDGSSQRQAKDAEASQDNSQLGTHFSPSDDQDLQDAQQAQYSHITETPLASDAPVPDEDSHDEVFFESQEGDDSQMQDLKLAQGETIAPQSETPELPSQLESQVEPINSSNNSTPKAKSSHYGTPAPGRADSLGSPSPDLVSHEARQDYTNLIKDAGFRSQVPSSVTKGVDQDLAGTPGDAAVFEKLLQEMEPRSDAVYSPKFTDYGASSPARKQDTTPTPQDSYTQQTQASWITVDEPLSSQEPPQEEPPISEQAQSSWVTVDEAPSSPILPQSQIQPSEAPQSNWVTVDDPRSSPPVVAMSPKIAADDDDDVEAGNASDTSQGWETETEALPVASQDKKKLQKEDVPPKTRKRVPIGQGWGIWEQLAGKTSKSQSPPPNTENPILEVDLPATEESQTSATISYPKLSIESSFTSTIADHGRQPDFQSQDETFANDGLKQSSVLIATSPAPTPPEPALARETPEAQIFADLARAPTVPPYQRFLSKSPISARIAALLRSPVKVPSPLKAASPELPLREVSVPAVSEVNATTTSRVLVSPSPEPVGSAQKAVSDHSAKESTSSPGNSPPKPKDSPSSNHGSPTKEREQVHERSISREHHDDLETKPRHYSPPAHDVDSSDEFPSIEEVLSQRPLKSEKQSPPSTQDRPITIKKLSNPRKDSLESTFSDSNTFRRPSKSVDRPPSSKDRSFENRRSATRDSILSPSQSHHVKPRITKPRSSQPPPPPPVKPATMLIDLTQSSDVEYEPFKTHVTSVPSKKPLPPARDDSSPEPFESFLSQYSVDSDQDLPRSQKPAKVKKESMTGGGNKKNTNNRLSTSSQSSLNRIKGRRSGLRY